MVENEVNNKLKVKLETESLPSHSEKSGTSYLEYSWPCRFCTRDIAGVSVSSTSSSTEECNCLLLRLAVGYDIDVGGIINNRCHAYDVTIHNETM